MMLIMIKNSFYLREMEIGSNHNNKESITFWTDKFNN